MTSKQEAIKKLVKKYKDNYSIQAETMSSGVNGLQGAKVLIQILGKKEDGTSTVVRYVSAQGLGKDLKEAQDAAVIDAVESLGL
jgi:hypothetical protein